MLHQCSLLDLSKVGQLEIFPTTVDDFLQIVEDTGGLGVSGFSSKLIETSIRSTLLLLLSRNVIQKEK